MDQLILKKFREQLAAWIVPRLTAQRLPFQRLECCPEILTEAGRLTPDLVLWINRESQLAGSMILLPETADEAIYSRGVSMAKALGLEHFTIWSAHDVSIWTSSAALPKRLAVFALPAIEQVTPKDFHHAVDWLMEQLKLITVTTAPAPEELDSYYYANLCLHTLEDISPGLTDGARLAGGQLAADEWVAQAPLSKAWLSLWRLLYLLQHRQLPLALQPERMEVAMRYALADLASGSLAGLMQQENESPLHEYGAIRLYHLAGRLRQLSWPRSQEEATALFDILLSEANRSYNLASVLLPWDVSPAGLWVNCQPQSDNAPTDFSLVAPRPILAGWLCRKKSLASTAVSSRFAETVSALTAGQTYASAVAILSNTRPPIRQEREQRTLALRQAWPNRRFDLPRGTPAWVWDALHLAGMTTQQLSLLMPAGWHLVPGIKTLWGVLTERYQLSEATRLPEGHLALLLVGEQQSSIDVYLHIQADTILAPADSLANQPAGLLHIWLTAGPAVTSMLRQGKLAGAGNDPAHLSDLVWGVFLFLNTSLGNYLWQLGSGEASLPDTANDSLDAAIQYGVPLPNETILADLGMLGDPATSDRPDQGSLDRELELILGPLPQALVAPGDQGKDKPIASQRRHVPMDEIEARVFVDGAPRFPEHYLMHHYRPNLRGFELPGPLEVVALFFDTVHLKAQGTELTIEVTGTAVAEALILASHAGVTHLQLPADEALVEQLVNSYRADLTRLWDTLVSECRRYEPRRQSAILLAKKIWQKQQLPPKEIFNIKALQP